MAPTHPTVQKLKKLIDSKGLSEGGEFLRSVWSAKDTSLIVPLMLMRNYKADTERLDEMWLVIHTVEAYPIEVFFQHLVANAELIARRSPYLLNHLIHRIKNNKKYLDYFLKELRRNKPAKFDHLIAVLEEVKQECAELSEKVAAIDRMIAVLRK